MINEIYNQEIRIFVDSFVTMRHYATPTETPLCQLGPLLLPVMDCQPSCSGGLLLELESSNVLLAVSLKRAGWREAQPSAGQGSWGIFLSYELLRPAFTWNVALKGYVWSPWHLCVWLLGHPATDRHKQVHNRWVGHATIKYEEPLK